MDQDQLVRQVGYGISEDGRTVELRCYRANGTITHLWFDYDILANVALGIEGVAGMAFQQQRAALKGVDPRAVYPVATKTVVNLQGGTAADGRAVLSLELSTGSTLALSLEETQIRDLAAWLDAQAGEPQKRPASPD
jgi:hypothetical protein